MGKKVGGRGGFDKSKIVSSLVEREMEKCPHPEKVGWVSKAKAKQSIKSMRRANKRSDLESYLCACGAWHIGHKPGTKYR